MLRALPFRWTPETTTQDEVLGMLGIKLNGLAYDRRLVFDEVRLSESIKIAESPDLEEITFPVLERLGGLEISSNGKLSQIVFPALRVFTKDPNAANFSIAYNPALTTILMPQMASWGADSFGFSENALSAETVNGILARMVADPEFAFKQVDLTGGTNAAPTGQGLADKAALIARHCNIQTN